MLFDRLVLLCAGRVVYSGLVKDATAYFTSDELRYPARPRQNPAEYIIDIAGGKILPIGAVVSRSDLELEALFNRSNLMTPPSSQLSTEPLVFDFVRVRYRHKITQISMLMHRSFTSAVRNRTNLMYTLAKNIWLGMLIGVVFRGVAGHLEEPFYEADGQPTSDSNEFAGLLYFLLVYIWLSNGQIIPQCVEDSKLYWREIASHTYVPISYWVAAIVSELPFLLLFHTIFLLPVYLLCGFPYSASYYFFFWFVLGLANLFSMLFAQFLAFGTGSSLLAFAIYPVVFYVLGMFSSYTIRIDQLAPGFKWVAQVTFVRWAFQSLMVLEFDRYGDDGDDVLKDYSFDDRSKEYCAVIVLVNALAAAVLLYISLRKPSRKIVYLDLEPTLHLHDHGYNLEQSLLETVGADTRRIPGGFDTGRGRRAPTFRQSLVGAKSAAGNLLHSVAETFEFIESAPQGI